MNRLRNFVILGAPGGGKGTIAGKLIKDYALKHVLYINYDGFQQSIVILMFHRFQLEICSASMCTKTQHWGRRQRNLWTQVPLFLTNLLWTY